ncbi:MAG TPA: Smr/MutS family protein [Thermoanaerobaculia bacterium]|nr:Smr/MutS family protein [Thermoanaerobaculia bacterium]
MSEAAFSSSSILSQATAQALEFPSLLAVVARFAASDLGRERVLGLVPFEEEGPLRARRTLFEEASRLVGERALVPDFDVPLGDLLTRIATGRPPVEGGDLVRLADLGRATRTAAARIREAVPPCPALDALARGLPDVDPLLKKIERTLDRRGEVREDASPRLAALRRQIRTVREQIYRDLGDFVSGHKDELSEETIPMRGGRLVVMLQSGARGRSGGLVHGRSSTGRSFYFEPLQVVESNNNLQQSVEDEEAERRRILMELIEDARAALPALREHSGFLGELDLLQASVRFGDRCGGALPEIGARHGLRLLAARHPLLDPCLAEIREEALGQAGHEGDIVPLEVEFLSGRRILVITGPNAGGKTVSLKTTGILALMAMCGLPIPAAPGSRVPLLRRLVATVGDEQDLLSDRSTFSGRLLRLKEAWEGAGPDSLILLDELGSGTDPEEGAALAEALLEGLLEKGSLGVITTHLAQLAAAALELTGASCAAMEFDPASGRPTFRLVPGPPGASEALALGRRLGLPAEWLDRAEARLGSEHRDLRRLIAEVERVRQELAETRERLETERSDAEKLRRRLMDERAALEDERRNVSGKMKAELEQFRRDTTERLRREEVRLRERFEEGRRKGLAAEAVETLFAAAPVFGQEEEVPEGPLVVGEPVRHLGLGWQGVLEKLEDGRAEVLVRGKRVRARPEELAPAGAAQALKKERRAERETPSLRPEALRGREGDLEEPVSREINLIGMRVEPALEQLDAYLDQALLSSRKEVRVIHGHGSGRLRDAVRQHLRGHRGVAEVRSGAPNEGGNGATVVTFRGV